MTRVLCYRESHTCVPRVQQHKHHIIFMECIHILHLITQWVSHDPNHIYYFEIIERPIRSRLYSITYPFFRAWWLTLISNSQVRVPGVSMSSVAPTSSTHCVDAVTFDTLLSNSASRTSYSDTRLYSHIDQQSPMIITLDVKYTHNGSVWFRYSILTDSLLCPFDGLNYIKTQMSDQRILSHDTYDSQFHQIFFFHTLLSIWIQCAGDTFQMCVVLSLHDTHLHITSSILDI